MKMKILSIFSFAILSLFVFSACEEDPDPPPQKTKTELISQGNWKFQGATYGGTDISSQPQIACFIDNIFTVSANGTGVVDEGAVSCNPSTAGPFTWNFQTNETELFISKALVSGGSNVWSVVTLNDNNLVISQTVTMPPAPAALLVITFKH
jgi:hypothetical protein